MSDAPWRFQLFGCAGALLAWACSSCRPSSQRKGVLILDAYFYWYLGEQPHDIASINKSVTSTLVGIAVDRGRLEPDQTVLELFSDIGPVPADDGKEDIQVSDLLTMSSGLACGYLPGEQELYGMIASEIYVLCWRYRRMSPLHRPRGAALVPGGSRHRFALLP